VLMRFIITDFQFELRLRTIESSEWQNRYL